MRGLRKERPTSTMHFRGTYHQAMNGLRRVGHAVEMGVSVYNGVKTAVAIGRALAPYADLMAAAV